MKPSFVLDCSLAMTWCFPDEATPETDQLLTRLGNEGAAIPGWWLVEISNVLVLAEKKKRITPSRVSEFIALIESFDFDIDNEAPGRAFAHLIPLCRSYGLTSYDAIYLDLALRRQLPLATLDDDLRAAAKKAGVALLGK